MLLTNVTSNFRLPHFGISFCRFYFALCFFLHIRFTQHQFCLFFFFFLLLGASFLLIRISLSMREIYTRIDVLCTPLRLHQHRNRHGNFCFRMQSSCDDGRWNKITRFYDKCHRCRHSLLRSSQHSVLMAEKPNAVAMQKQIIANLNVELGGNEFFRINFDWLTGHVNTWTYEQHSKRIWCAKFGSCNSHTEEKRKKETKWNSDLVETGTHRKHDETMIGKFSLTSLPTTRLLARHGHITAHYLLLCFLHFASFYSRFVTENWE